jgi:hypothetical protein
MGDTDTDAGSISYTNSDDTMTFRAAAAARMALSSTGLDVTGTVTADGLTVDGGGSNVTVSFAPSSTFSTTVDFTNASSAFQIVSFGSGSASADNFRIRDAGASRLNIAGNGDISFYEDTGTTPKFFWDASEESLNIGTTSGTADRRLHITGAGPSTAASQFGIVANPSYPTSVTANVFNLYTGPNLTSGTTLTNLYNLYLEANNITGSTVTNSFGLYQAGSGDKNYFAGNVGIGTSSPSSLLQVGVPLTATAGIRVSGSNLNIDAGYQSAGVNGTAAAPCLIIGGDADTGFFHPASDTLAISTLGNERLRITSAGRVGIGTDSPGTPLDVIGGIRSRVSSGSAILYLNNGATQHSIQNDSNELVFYENAIEAFRVDISGNLLVGTASTVGSFGAKLEILGATGGGRCINTKVTVDTSSNHITFHNGNGQVGSISTNGSTTSYNTSSDARLKENIADAEDAGAKVDAIQVRQFDWKADGSHQDYGMVAQELMTVAPEAVSGDPESDDMMGVDYSKLVPMLVKEIQSLRARVAQLEGA